MKMMNDAGAVNRQYATSDRLRTRIGLHEKYSVNPQPFAEWIFDQYQLRPGDAILYVGCGTGQMWRGRVERLPEGCRLTLTDLSPGMVDSARAMLAGAPGVEFGCADIQALPFEDESMDVVIANMMLYHVPELGRGLSEVRRVLRAGGRFYCATFGENGVGRFVAEVLGGPGAQLAPASFTLQNGRAALEAKFEAVERLDYEDELRVTDARDLAEYIRSMQGMEYAQRLSDEELLERLEALRTNGAIRVPKEYGMFRARAGVC